LIVSSCSSSPLAHLSTSFYISGTVYVKFSAKSLSQN
jgi:hypothetical protein